MHETPKTKTETKAMGYSCTARAALTLDAIEREIAKRYPGGKTSNRMPDGGFHERGRENRDGAITGTVFKLVRVYSEAERREAAKQIGIPDNPEWVCDPCQRSGSYRIEPDGKVKRFPGLPRDLIAKAEKEGAAEYARIYERSGANI